MYLKSLSLLNFKNYSDTSFDLSPDINVFIGENGAGKTNILDAVYFLSFCRSFLNPIDRQCIQLDQKFFLLQGKYVMEDKEVSITCSIKEGQKKIVKRNKKEYDKFKKTIEQMRKSGKYSKKDVDEYEKKHSIVLYLLHFVSNASNAFLFAYFF